MPYLYPEKTPLSNPGQKTYWGSLYGSADALALVEYAQQQSQVILLIANDIAHLDILYKSLNFYNDTLDILKFDNWEVLPYDQFSPHPDITSNRLSTLSKLKQLKKVLLSPHWKPCFPTCVLLNLAKNSALILKSATI